VEKLYITMEKPYIAVEKLYITMKKPYIAVERLCIAMQKLYITMEKPYIAVEKPYIAVKRLCIGGEGLFIAVETMDSQAGDARRIRPSRREGKKQGLLCRNPLKKLALRQDRANLVAIASYPATSIERLISCSPDVRR